MLLYHRYEVIETVQEGVHLVRDLADPCATEVVLKEVRADGDRTRADLVREFRVLVGLRHPGIVRVLDFGGDATGARYLTMERVPGETLDRVMPRAGPAQVIALFVQAADALAWAHAHGVLHGDLKPANLLARLEPSPRLAIVDFGLARHVVGAPEASGGSLGFVAPEVLGGAAPSVASDLFGLGAAFLAALGGGPPETFAVGAAVPSHVPAALAAVLAALLAPDPRARPVDAAAVLRRLGTSPTAGTAAPPFVGRRVDLDLLSRRRPAVVVLRGPTGSGKTRLLQEARWRLQLDERLVVETRCTGADAPPLFGLPAVARALAAADPTGATDRAAPAEPSGPLDTLLGRAGPACALFIDDAHLADAATLELLASVVRACAAPRPTTLVLACTPGPVADRLLEAAPGVEALELGPLGRTDVDALVAAELGRADDDLARALFERSGGVPLFVADLLRALGERTERGERDPAALVLSSASCAVVRDTLAALPRASRDAVAVLAALGRPATAGELAAFADGADDAALQCAETAGLAAPGPTGWRLAAAATASAIEGPEARTLHARLAERLARRGAPTDEVDRHRAAAGALDAALRVAETLGARQAFREAFDVLAPFRSAVPTAAPERVLAWAAAATRAGEHAAAREALDPLLAHPDAGVRVRAELVLGGVLERLGDLAAARARLAAALPALDRPVDLATARLGLARVAALSGDPAGAAEHAQAGLAAHGGLEIPLRIQLGSARARLGSADDALAELQRARDEARSAGETRLAAAALGHQAIVRAARGELVAARDLFAQALAEAETAGDTAALPAHLLNLAGLHKTLQDPATAIDLLRRAEALARRLGRTGPLATALINLGDLYAGLGADEEALAAAREAGELAGRSGVRAVGAQAALVEAEVEMRRDPRRARRLAESARTVFGEIGEAARAAEARCVEGELALALDDLPGARAALQDARASAAPDLAPRLDLLDAGILRAEGAAAAAMERIDRAVAAASAAGRLDLAACGEAAAAELLDEIGSPLGGERRRRAVERLSIAALRLPPAVREAFWKLPWRARARAGVGGATPPSPGAGVPGAGQPAAGATTGEAAAWRLLALAPRIAAERDAQRVLELALDAGLSVLGGERGFLLLRDGADWRVAAARNIDHETIRRPSFKFSRSVAEQVAASGEPLLTASAVDDPRLAAARSVHQLALQSILCVPIRSPEKVLGTIYFENRFSRGRFSEEHLRLALALADQVALALEAGRLERELRERAEQLDGTRAELARRVETQEDELARLEREVRRSREEVVLRHEYSGIVGRGAAMRRLLGTLDRAADTGLPVLIEGATGTGKELVARALHANGPRRARPFVTVNCGALPDLLLESELFGHVRGAFTGADRARGGLMREASGGTLFLDEVGEMSPAMQVKLLRALQSGEVTPLGADRPVPVDVRIVAATNRRLADAVRDGRFREDLFYRLAVIRLEVPALAERREDLAELAEHFLRRAAERAGATPKRLSRGALAALLRHDFPGNVRELENALSHAVVFAAGDEIRAADLALGTLGTGDAPLAMPSGGSRRDMLRAADRRLVERALAECDHNLSAAARRLGISRPTLYRRLADYGLARRPSAHRTASVSERT